jgi:hemolysin activation/secretion protein
MTTRLRLFLCAFGAVLGACAPAHAAPPAAPPDAGQTLHELQQPPLPALPGAVAPLTIEGPEEGHSADDFRFLIKEIRITGNTRIPTPTLRALVSDLTGAEHTLAELRAAAARITDYYRQRGFPVARAYLPAQEIRDATVTIDIIEGRLDQHLLENHSRLSDTRIQASLDHLEEGQVLESSRIDRSLLLLNATPGVGGSRATLQPGTSVGTSTLVVTADPGPTFSGDAQLDNYGNRYTGQNRLGGSVYVNSPLHLGDQLAVNAVSTGRGLLYGRLAYQLPVGGDGLRVGAAVFDTRYHLGKDFSVLEAHGTASGASLFTTYPFVLRQQTNLTATVTAEKKHLTDYVDLTGTVTEKHVYLGNFEFSGSHRDTLAGGGLTSASVLLAAGDLDIQSPLARFIDELSAGSDGRYIRLSYSLARLQRLTDSTTVSLAVSGQRSNKNLDSSEKFSLGGAEGVRAYPEGEGIGDEGYLLNLELHQELTRLLQGVLFYDSGSVILNRKPFQIGIPNSRRLAGAGLGASLRLGQFQIKATVAWRTAGGEPQSIPSYAVRTPNLWLQIHKTF